MLPMSDEINLKLRKQQHRGPTSSMFLIKRNDTSSCKMFNFHHKALTQLAEKMWRPNF